MLAYVGASKSRRGARENDDRLLCLSRIALVRWFSSSLDDTYVQLWNGRFAWLVSLCPCYRQIGFFGTTRQLVWNGYVCSLRHRPAGLPYPTMSQLHQLPRADAQSQTLTSLLRLLPWVEKGTKPAIVNGQGFFNIDVNAVKTILYIVCVKGPRCDSSQAVS